MSLPGATLLVVALVLTILGAVTWPPEGLFFALPYLFLLPPVPLFVVGIVLLILGRRKRAPTKSSMGAV